MFILFAFIVIAFSWMTLKFLAELFGLVFGEIFYEPIQWAKLTFKRFVKSARSPAYRSFLARRRSFDKTGVVFASGISQEHISANLTCSVDSALSKKAFRQSQWYPESELPEDVEFAYETWCLFNLGDIPKHSFFS